MRVRSAVVSVVLAVAAVLGGAVVAAADDGGELTPREQAGLQAATQVVGALLGGGGTGS